MEQKEHLIQDACEIYAVAMMQERAEQLGVSQSKLSPELHRTFLEHISEKGISDADFRRFPQYKSNVEEHATFFVERLTDYKKPRDLKFVCTEKEARNNSLKGDFTVTIDDRETISISLKNYRNSIARPQVSAGTFNSFALSFLLPADPGVGMVRDPRTDTAFKGSNKAKRDEVLSAIGRAHAVPMLRKLDDLNNEIKERFVNSEEFRFLDEDKFDVERKRVGNEGAVIIHGLLSSIPIDQIRKQIVDRIGFAGNEEQLMFDPKRYSDSLTVPKFHDLIHNVRHDADFSFSIKGQGIAFEFSSHSEEVLSIHVPFTINKNGAWISETYAGRRLHPKEGVHLATGERRPKKSRELATSVNTYLDLQSTGIFLER